MKDGTALSSPCQIPRLFGTLIEFGKCSSNLFHEKEQHILYFTILFVHFWPCKTVSLFLKMIFSAELAAISFIWNRSFITKKAVGHSYCRTAPIDLQLGRKSVFFSETKRCFNMCQQHLMPIECFDIQTYLNVRNCGLHLLGKINSPVMSFSSCAIRRAVCSLMCLALVTWLRKAPGPNLTFMDSHTPQL